MAELIALSTGSSQRGRGWANLRENSMVWRERRESKRENKSIKQKFKGSSLARNDRRGLAVTAGRDSASTSSPHFVIVLSHVQWKKAVQDLSTVGQCSLFPEVHATCLQM